MIETIKKSRITLTKQHQQLLSQNEVLAYQAHYDFLTGLPNRILFNDRLEHAIEKAHVSGKKVALLFIDLDHFKEINDSLGHDFGDKLLQKVTAQFQGIMGANNTLSRLGGDEFTVILEELQKAEEASHVAQLLIDLFAEPLFIEEKRLYVSCSIGISIYPDDGKDARNLFQYADAAMYKAKEEGRNNFQYYSAEMTELSLQKIVVETNLREGLKKGELVVYYQPQINAKTGVVSGMEALVRWQSPLFGLISPASFLPVAEASGLIIELDRFVMQSALTQIAKWRKEGLDTGVLAMNLTVKQLQQKDFLSYLQTLMQETGCDPKYLELEVTEGQIMTRPEEAIRILGEINQLGIRLSVDDFGTGYSSLSYLKKLPIHKLKIDQSFIKELPYDEEDVAITRAVIALAQSLNLNIIAEGVETLEQQEFLVRNGCEHIQGYFYAKPMPADEVEIFLKKQHRRDD
jgi:diguanylate cyclase (GGDEF)-like protein